MLDIALLQQLLNNLKAQENVPPEVQIQFDQMEKNLTHTKSFLIYAHEHKEHNHRETVKGSLATLREMIYAADDILLDFRIRYDYRTDASMMQWYPRNQITNRLKEINVQMNQVLQNLHMYLVPMMSLKNNHDESNHNRRWTTHIYDQSEIVGLGEDTEKIKRWILHENQKLQRVGVVGMGGLGKTTVAQNIFNDKDVNERFDKMVWVSVSQTFTATNIMMNMLEQLNEDGRSCTSEAMLLEKIQETLKDKTYLIIMDDVWETENGFVWLEQIIGGLPKEEKHNCCIIITTRNEQVAKSMGVMERRIHRLKLLDQDESWELFCKLAFMSTKGICKNVEFVRVGKEIVRKCGGLPLAIKTIGALLSTKTHSIREWENIWDKFHDKLMDNRYESSIITSLQLSYDELPPELKHCILCFSIYPEDSEISAEQLVNWWVGEGFVSGNERRTATQKAFDCLTELVSRCLVEVVNHRGYDGKIFNCKMHDMVRELIIKMAKEEAFCSFGDGNVQQFNSESGHLGLTSKIKTQSLQQSNSKLRALLCTEICPFPSTGLANVNSLRVLDLSQSKLNGDFRIDDLLRWIKSQSRLAYLNLRGVAQLTEVRDWIGKLRNLQILILFECHNLEKLSSNITTLRNLTVLDIGNCPSLQNLPHGLGKLSNLQELSGFKIVSQGEDGCRLGDLKSLTNLRVLRINIREDDDIKDEELQVLSDLHFLKVLSIDTKDCENETIMKQLDQLRPPQCLEELYLRYYSGSIIPSWITPFNLPCLQYLCIENGQLTGMSPSFWVTKHKYWNLRSLCLKYLPRMKMHWVTVQEMMPLIEYVEASHCYMLQNFPFDVEHHGVWRKKDGQEERQTAY